MANYIIFDGFRMDARTRDMIVEARRICKAPLVITQGGFNKGGVTASAGTHDGGGALDIRARDLSDDERDEAVLRLRQVGFFASLRLASEGPWPVHIHCIAVGCDSLSYGAARQVADYKIGKNGLANHKADKGNRLYAGNTWESYKASMQGSPTTDAPAKVGAYRVSLSAVAYAANGPAYFRSGQIVALNSAQNFHAWLRRIGVISQRNADVWARAIRQANWAGARSEYRAAIVRFQTRYDLTPDGVVGPLTKAKIAALMPRSTYRVVA